jgi:hypothetical protein
VVSCQLVYLSYCFHPSLSFLFGSLKQFGSVTGLWSLFYQKEYSRLVQGFTNRVELSPFFFESSLVVLGVFSLFGFVTLGLFFVKLCLGG